MSVYEGVFRIFWVPSGGGIANASAPTVAEITAGTEVTDYVPKDGWRPNVRNNRVDNTSLSTTFDAEQMGSHGAQLSVTFKRDFPDEAAWDLFKTRGASGHLVALPLKGSGAVAAADAAEVWPVEAGAPVPQNTAANQQQRFSVDFAVTAEPTLTAVVAA